MCCVASAVEVSTPTLEMDQKSREALAQVPYAIAQKFPDDLWYYWATSHNELEYRIAAESRSQSRPIYQQENEVTDYNSTSPQWSYWYGDRGGNSSGQIDTQRSHRVFYEKVGGLPAWIYNPYCR